MTPDKCPGCGAKLRPDMLACPNCPMSFPEDDGPSVGAVNPLKQSRYYKFVFPTVLLSVIGGGVWYMGAGLMHLGQENAKSDGINVMDQITKGAPAKKNGVLITGDNFSGGSAPGEPASGGGASGGGASGASGETAPGTPGSSPDSKAPDDGGAVFITRVDGNGAPIVSDDHKAPAKSTRPPPPVETPPSEWKLRGVVYDLTTLKPLAGCWMVFSDEETNRSIKTRTDSTGRYRTIVPALRSGSGYSVAIDKGGYAPNYLDPGTEGVREMDSGRRWGMARDLASMLTAAPATVETASAKPLVTDFYLAPRP